MNYKESDLVFVWNDKRGTVILGGVTYKHYLDRKKRDNLELIGPWSKEAAAKLYKLKTQRGLSLMAAKTVINPVQSEQIPPDSELRAEIHREDKRPESPERVRAAQYLPELEGATLKEMQAIAGEFNLSPGRMNKAEMQEWLTDELNKI